MTPLLPPFRCPDSQPETCLPFTNLNPVSPREVESPACFRIWAFQVGSAKMKTPKSRRRLKVFFDGGCRPNPGRIEAAVVVRGVPRLFDDLGHGTNSDAEWLALISAMKLTQSLGLTDIEFIGDSTEVIQQAKRALRTGELSLAHAASFLALAAETPPMRIRWIKREQNLAGIALAARHPR